MHKVAILALDGVVSPDLAVPSEVFGHTRVDEHAVYDVMVCGETSTVRSRTFDIRPRWNLDILSVAETIVVPGTEGPLLEVSHEVVTAIRQAAARGCRIVSICTGAFIVAASGLLDGRRATTHWLAAPLLAQTYPAIKVDPNVLFIDEGQILTSAGASAGMDLCLHLIRRDHGQAVAIRSARLAVAPLDREGGQAQFIDHVPPGSGTSLATLLNWLSENAHRPLSLADIAQHSALSCRTLTRRFKEQVGTTPLQWVLAARVRRAQELLETSDLSVDQISAAVGFENVTSFRERFRRTVSVSPAQYRRSFAG